VSLADEATLISGINLRNSEVCSVVNFVFLVIEMKTLFRIALLFQLVGGVVITAKAADVTEAELMQAATELAQQYDSHYAAADSAGMAAVYASDGILVSPGGPIIRGRVALTAYYSKRFASGAKGHAIKVLEVHVQGNGGYGLSEFSVSTPGADGQLHEVHGTIVSIYQHDPDGWHLSLVVPTVPARKR
jgi:ketosteroid isomerase-like protein